MARHSTDGSDSDVRDGENDWFAELETARKAHRAPSVETGPAPRKTGVVPVEARPTLERTRADESWDEARKAELVARIAEKQSTVEVTCERYGLPPEEVQDWLRAFRRSALLAVDARLTETLIGQGADPAVLTADEFTGRLGDSTLIDLLQSIHMTRQSAIIMVTHDGLESRVWCSRGTVVDAKSGRLEAEAAVHRIVSFDHGRVVADFRAVPRARTVETPTPRLLLEAAHRKDESIRLWRRLGDGQTAYRLTAPGKAGLELLTPAEGALLASFDQPRSLLDALRDSEVGDVETLSSLARMIDQRFIERDPSTTVTLSPVNATPIREAKALPALNRPRASRRWATAPARVLVWAAGALALATLASAWSWRLSAAREPSPAPAAQRPAPAPAASVTSVAEPVASYPVTAIPLVPLPPPAPTVASQPAISPPVHEAKAIPRAKLARPARRVPRDKTATPRPERAREPRIQGLDADIPQVQVIE